MKNMMLEYAVNLKIGSTPDLVLMPTIRSINTTDIKSVNHFTKDHELVTSELEYLSAA